MPLTDLKLWRRVAAAPLPADSEGRTFVAQLARVHRVSDATACGAIEEYRRFAYLAGRGQGRMVPSRQIDAVWHLHLTHSRDYWEEFCPAIDRRIHHAPGRPEGHEDDFRATLAAYGAEFDAPAPPHFWGRPRPTGRIRRGLGGVMLSGTLIAAPAGALGGAGPMAAEVGVLAILAGAAGIATLPSALRRLVRPPEPVLVDAPRLPAGGLRGVSVGAAECGAVCG